MIPSAEVAAATLTHSVEAVEVVTPIPSEVVELVATEAWPTHLAVALSSQPDPSSGGTAAQNPLYPGRQNRQPSHVRQRGE